MVSMTKPRRRENEETMSIVKLQVIGYFAPILDLNDLS